jgi:hypothetical protein
VTASKNHVGIPEQDEVVVGSMKPFAAGGVYLNFVGDEGQNRVLAAYCTKKYKRLANIKAEWDPDNVFRGNQDIKPKK